MNVIEVNNVSKIEEGRPIINDISFTVQPFQNIAIAGATGSGKTTLLKIIAGLVQASAGSVKLNGQKVAGPEEKLLPGHPQIAYLSQYFELRHHYKVEELLSMANQLSASEAAHIYDICQISNFLKRWTHQLSGGERQRIALACLLVAKPSLLILDEPFSNLDPLHKTLLKKVIADVSEQLRISCLLVSHDALDTLPWADEIIILNEGRVVQQGTPQQVYYHPASDYAASLFGRYTKLPPALAAAFASRLLIDENKLPQYIRPELFIVDQEPNGVMGMIANVRFMGSYYELEVVASDTLIVANTHQARLSAGDVIYLSINPQLITV